METEAENGDQGMVWGKSLPVPSVQEMVRNDSQSVPERYIQEHQDRPWGSEFCPASQIPVIDLQLLACGDEDERTKLDFACREWGFFQVSQPIQVHNGFPYTNV